MPQPMPFPCGKEHQPACPPQPASGTYTLAEIQEHGWNCYQKGLKDANNARPSEPQRDDL